MFSAASRRPYQRRTPEKPRMSAQFTRRAAARARGGSRAVRKSTPRWAPWRMVRPATRNTDQMPANRVTSSPHEMLGRKVR